MTTRLMMTTAAAGLAALMASAGLTSPAVASPLNTAITLTVWHGVNLGSGSGAASEQALPSAAPLLLNLGTVSYTGAINFGSPPGGNTIGSFLASGGVTAPLASTLVPLSHGGFVDATLMRFTFNLPTATTGTITHDDGISLFAAGTSTTNLLPGFSAPTSLATTSYALAAGTYDLWYSEVNGLPAALTFDVATRASVPEPISLALLGTGLVGVGMARRRAGRA